MSTSKPQPLSPESLTTLTNYSNLLHLLHHRNKNQHRRSPWYRHFSTFRRHTAALLHTHTTLATIPATNHARTVFLKTTKPRLLTRLAQEIELWTNVLVPRWQRAFSQVVADGRFAVFGVVLIGVLAGVAGLLGVTGHLEEVGQGEVERVLEEFGRDAEVLGLGGLPERLVVEGQSQRGGKGEVDNDRGVPEMEGGDVGEVVAREAERDEGELVSRDVVARDDDATPTPAIEPTAPTERESSTQASTVRTDIEPKATALKRRAEPKAKATKKKRKKGDAIDDLFSGL